MVRNKMRVRGVWAVVVAAALVPATGAAQFGDIPLTPREQLSVLGGSVNGAVWSKLYPSRTASMFATQPYVQDYRARYMSALLSDRVAIAQFIGEEGVERYAAGQRLRTLLGPRSHSTPIGPDSVYWNSVSGKVNVLEAKGGSSTLKWTYGSLQGTNTNTTRSAGGILTRAGTNWSERIHAARVIKAAQRGHLETGVVRTSHVLGTPNAPKQTGGVNVDDVAKKARLIERDLVKRNPRLRAVFKQAGFRHRMDRLVYHGARWMPHRISTSGSLASSRFLRLWQVGNRWLLPVGLGVAGVTVAITYYQFATGAINYRDFLHNSSGAAILLVLTGGGAVMGGFLFGFGSVPGAVIGSMLALPVQLGLEWVMDQRYGEFRQAQRKAVDRTVEKLYLRNAVLPRDQ